MLITRSIAEQIIAQLSQVIEPNINFIDINGVIIASTDPLRVGTIHGGALRIIREKLIELVIERDDEYTGSRNGTNLPIEFNHQIVGVIGLTGRSDEVKQYGRIIKKMTEVLLMEIFLSEKKNTERMAIERFLEEWVFGRYDMQHPKEFRFRAESLGIDINEPHRIMVVAVRDGEGNTASEKTLNQMYQQLLYMMDRAGHPLVFRTSTQFVCILRKVTDIDVIMLAAEVRKLLETTQSCRVFIGIDSDDDKPLKTSFKNASIALQVSYNSQKNVHIYSILNIDIALVAMIEKNKTAYLEEFFHGISDHEIAQHIDVLRNYYDCEGSITKASEKLFIHKNTLQYKLNKITEITGYDPRFISTSYLFIVAIKMYNLLTNKDQL